MMSGWIRWQDVGYFYYLLLILTFIIYYFFVEKQFNKKLSQAFGQKISNYLTQSLSVQKRRLQLIIQMLGLCFVVLALVRPQMGVSHQEVKSQGVELMIVADVSESMMSEDVKPSRLTQMKIELSRLLDLMPGNKIGVIAFAGSSALLSPLTSDPNALKMYVDSLDINSVSTQGTNFETALKYAKEAFEKGGVTQDSFSRTTRVILVTSDGEDQEKGALKAAEELAQQGFKIFTIAYGSEKGGGIPVHDMMGNMIGYKKDSNGQPVLTQVKGDFLKSLADAGGGQFYFAYFNGDHLKKLVGDIDQLEKTEFQSKMMTQYDEKYIWPLTLGIILILVSLFISDRKTEDETWMGKYEGI